MKGRGPEDIDMLICRENTEGAYAQMGGVFKKGTADEVTISEDTQRMMLKNREKW